MNPPQSAWAVIGGGPHGLATVKAFQQLGLAAVGYEQEDTVGGTWNYGAENSRITESTHLISTKPFTQFPDFPMPYSYPDYPSHKQALAYLQSYAAHFDLNRHYRLGHRVISVDEIEDLDLWAVTSEDTDTGELNTDYYAGVVIANGHNWFPKPVTYPGQAEFTGEILSAADYKRRDQLTGRRVLVVGAGNTGCDIAVDAAQLARRTWHSSRRGYWYLPKYAFGRPADQTGDLMSALRLPKRVRRTLSKVTVRATVGDLTRFGLPKPDHDLLGSHPIVNQQLPYYVGHGDITPVPDIDHFAGDQVVLTDGQVLTPDLVIFATGYLARFPFLDEGLLNYEAGRPVLGRHMFSVRQPTLVVSGLLQTDSGQWTLAHWQAVLTAQYADRLQTNPRQALAYHRRVAGHSATDGDKFVRTSRHYYEVSHQEYLQELAQDIAMLEAL